MKNKDVFFIKLIVCVVPKYTFTIWVLDFYDETYIFVEKKGTQKEPQKVRKKKTMSSCLPYGVTGIQSILRKPCLGI